MRRTIRLVFLATTMLVSSIDGAALAATRPSAELVQSTMKDFATLLEHRTEEARREAEEGSVGLERLAHEAARFRRYLEWLTGQVQLLPEADQRALTTTLTGIEGLVWNLERAAEGRRLPTRSVDGEERQIGSVSGATESTFAPANNSCAQATPVTTGMYSGTTVGATNDGNASCGSAYLSPDVWLSFTPPMSGYYNYIIETYASSFDTVLSLHSACPGTVENQLECNDDTNGTSSALTPSQYLYSSRQYLIRVAGVGGATGTYRVYITYRGSSILGTVSEVDGGAPVPDGLVRALDDEGMYVRSTSIGDDGSWRMDYLTSGSYALMGPTGNYSSPWLTELWNDHSCPGGACDPSAADRVTTLPGASVTGIDFAVHRAGRIVGSAVDDTTGQPIENASIRVYDMTGDLVFTRYTDSTGSFDIVGLDAGAHFVTATHDLYRGEVHDDLPCNDGCDPTAGTPVQVELDQTTTVSFQLSARSSLSGTVVSSADGAPIYGATVTIYRSNGYSVKYVYTDSVGAWWAGGLDAGVYYAKAAGTGFVSQLFQGTDCPISCSPAVDGTPIDLGENQSLGGVDFELLPKGTISGSVLDATTGEPVSGSCTVYLYREDGSSAGSSYVTSGRFESNPPLAPGRYRVRTQSTGYRDELFDDVPCEGGCDLDAGTWVTVTTGAASTASFSLVPAGRIVGTVTLEGTGEPLYVTVKVWSGSGQQVASAWTSSGTYTIGGLDPGLYFVSTSGSSSPYPLHELYDDIPCWRGVPDSCDATAGTPVVVSDGTSAQVDFALPRGGTVSGTVTEAGTGNPLSASVYIRNVSGSFEKSVSCWSGSYSAAGLAPDTYRVFADATYHADSAYPGVVCAGEFPTYCEPDIGLPVEVGLGADVTDIHIPLPRLATITGSVVPALASDTCSGCRASLWTASGLSDYDYVDSNSTFELRAVWPGTYYVSASDYSSSNLLPQIYDGLDCDGEVSPSAAPGCRPTDGTPIEIGLGGSVSGIDLELRSKGAITGTLWNLQSGQPVTLRDVLIWDASSQSVRSVQVDPLGRFEVSRVFPGTYHIASRRPASGDPTLLDMLYQGYSCFTTPSTVGCDPTKGTPVVVHAGETVRGIDLYLPTIPTGLAGTVVEAVGEEAIADIAVDIWDASSGAHATRVRSSAPGAWLAELEPGTYLLSTANHLGYTDQVWGGPECPAGGPCDPTLGTPVVVGSDGPVGGIRFRLTARGLFSDGFESGSASAWSSSAP